MLGNSGIVLDEGSVKELVLTLLSTSEDGNIDYVADLMDGKESFDDLLEDIYGVSFEQYHSIVQDIIPFANKRKTADNQYIYEFKYDGDLICCSNPIDAEFLSGDTDSISALYKNMDNTASIKHERISRRGKEKCN